jgi:hypothetical protein
MDGGYGSGYSWWGLILAIVVILIIIIVMTMIFRHRKHNYEQSRRLEQLDLSDELDHLLFPQIQQEMNASAIKYSPEISAAELKTTIKLLYDEDVPAERLDIVAWNAKHWQKVDNTHGHAARYRPEYRSIYDLREQLGLPLVITRFKKDIEHTVEDDPDPKAVSALRYLLEQHKMLRAQQLIREVLTDRMRILNKMLVKRNTRLDIGAYWHIPFDELGIFRSTDGYPLGIKVGKFDHTLSTGVDGRLNLLCAEGDFAQLVKIYDAYAAK